MSARIFPDCQTPDCSQTALSFSSFCWHHTNQKNYAATLQKNIESSEVPATLNLNKVECDHLDFSNLSLKGSSFSQAKIAHASFIGTDLSGSDMIGVRFNHCDFVGAQMNGVNFTRASLTDCSFSHADLREACFVESDFTEVDFMNAQLSHCVLWNCDLSGAMHLKKKNFRDKDSRDRKKKPCLSEQNPLVAYESYRSLKHCLRERGLYEDAGWAAYKELTMQRKVYFKARNVNYISSLLMDLLSGYTEKPDRVVIASLCIVSFFSALYYFLNAIRPVYDGSAQGVNFLDCLYFSFITFTTVGFGDFVPHSYWWTKSLVALEAFCGPFMSGLFVFTLTRRYAAG